MQSCERRRRFDNGAITKNALWADIISAAIFLSVCLFGWQRGEVVLIVVKCAEIVGGGVIIYLPIFPVCHCTAVAPCDDLSESRE